MKNLYKNPILTLFLCLIFSASAFATQPKEEKQKVFKKTYKPSSGDELSIINKYGDVNISTHEKSEVNVYVTILAWARNEDKAQETLDRIEIKQTEQGNGTRFETSITDKRGGYEYFNNREGFEIKYEVKVPANLDLDIENKFGAINLGDTKGRVDITLKHGSLSTGRLSANNHDIAVKHGNIDIMEIGVADITIEHGDISIEKSTSTLDIDTRHSNVRIEEADILHLDAAHGSIRLGRIGQFSGENSHGSFEVDRIERSIILDIRHGRCEVEEIGKNFQEVDIENAHGSISVSFDEGASFSFDASTSHASISNRLSGVSITRQEDESHRSRLAGKVNGGGKGTVRLTNSHGSIRIN